MLPIFLQSFQNIQLAQPIHQVIALIIREKKLSPLQTTYSILFLQRAYSNKDAYSGDLCFPGGHREDGETIIQTAIRQTRQQVGLKLEKSQCIGAINHRFITRRSAKQLRKRMVMGVLVFYLGQTEGSGSQISLNLTEIRDYKWVDISVFFQGQKQKLKYWLYTNEKIGKDIPKNFLECPSYQIGMDRGLWGLTLMIMHKFLTQILSYPLHDSKTINYEFIQQFLEHSLKYSLVENIKKQKQTAQYHQFMTEEQRWNVIKMKPKI